MEIENNKLYLLYNWVKNKLEVLKMYSIYIFILKGLWGDIYVINYLY